MSEMETDETTGRAPPVDSAMGAWVGREAEDVPPGWMDNVVKRLLQQVNRQLIRAEIAKDDEQNDEKSRDMNSRSLAQLELTLERVSTISKPSARNRASQQRPMPSMPAHWKNLNAESISLLPPEQQARIWEMLNDQTAALLLRSWFFWARKEQRPPDGCWNTWLYLGGRGAGKTRAGAEWIADGVQSRTFRHIALVGATFNDARAVMVEGVSGLMGVAKGATYEPSNHRVRWEGGAIATILSAEEPDGIRGHQFDGGMGR